MNNKTREERYCEGISFEERIENKLNMLFDEIINIEANIEKTNAKNEIKKLQEEIKNMNKELEYRKNDLESLDRHYPSKIQYFQSIGR